MLIVPSDSWFFAKLLIGRHLFKIFVGTALDSIMNKNVIYILLILII